MAELTLKAEPRQSIVNSAAETVHTLSGASVGKKGQRSPHQKFIPNSQKPSTVEGVLSQAMKGEALTSPDKGAQHWSPLPSETEHHHSELHLSLSTLLPVHTPQRTPTLCLRFLFTASGGCVPCLGPRGSLKAFKYSDQIPSIPGSPDVPLQTELLKSSR